MSFEETLPDLTKESLPPPNADTLGGLFATCRLRQGLTVQDIAALTKYSVSQIQALEDKKWDQLHNGFALRALVRKYAQILKIDPEQALQMLVNETNNAKLVRDTRSMINSRYFAKQAEGAFYDGIPWSLLLRVILALLIIAVVFSFASGYLTPEDVPFDVVKNWFQGK